MLDIDQKNKGDWFNVHSNTLRMLRNFRRHSTNRLCEAATTYSALQLLHDLSDQTVTLSEFRMSFKVDLE